MEGIEQVICLYIVVFLLFVFFSLQMDSYLQINSYYFQPFSEIILTSTIERRSDIFIKTSIIRYQSKII